LAGYFRQTGTYPSGRVAISLIERQTPGKTAVCALFDKVARVEKSATRVAVSMKRGESRQAWHVRESLS